jgi:hypothetical protein
MEPAAIGARRVPSNQQTARAHRQSFARAEKFTVRLRRRARDAVLTDAAHASFAWRNITI